MVPYSSLYFCEFLLLPCSRRQPQVRSPLPVPYGIHLNKLDLRRGQCGNLAMDQLSPQQTSSSNSSRFLSSRTLTRRESGNDASDDLKGPLGLNPLYDLLDPAISDLIFVYGLGGEPQSTWTQSGDPSLYWPRVWLPKYSGFRDVRIHSFGYNSN